jgi:predicted deacetylase
MKELKLRPSTDVHDYQVRLRAAQKFLAKASLPAQYFAAPHLILHTSHKARLWRACRATR